jgi:hypothetical protein
MKHKNYIQYFGHVAGIKIEKKNGEILWAMIDSDKIDLVKAYCWHITSDGYIITWNKTALYLHNLLLNPENGLECDHINRNKLDNRLLNLRAVSRSSNLANRTFSNKTGFAGVYKQCKKFQAQITFNGTTKALGTFDTPEEAHEKFKQEHILIYGF